MALTPAKRKKIESLILEVLAIFEPQKVNYNSYKEKFKKMSNAQFESFLKYLDEDFNHNFYVEFLPFKNEPALKNILKALDFLGVPSEEYVYDPYENQDRENPVKTKYKVPVGYLFIKKMQHILSKKNSISTTIDKRSQKYNQVSGTDKVAKITEQELFALKAIGADKTLKELMGARADNDQMKTEMYRKIENEGYVSLDDISDDIDEKRTLNTVDTMLIGMGVKSDLITPSLVLAKSLREEFGDMPLPDAAANDQKEKTFDEVDREYNRLPKKQRKPNGNFDEREMDGLTSITPAIATFAMFEDTLLEKQKKTDYGLGILLEMNKNEFILTLQDILKRNLDEKQLYYGRDSLAYAKGIDDYPHISVLYNIYEEDYMRVYTDIVYLIKNYYKRDRIEVKFKDISLFENEHFDVLKIGIKSLDLFDLHFLLRNNIRNAYKFKEYEPHITLAYLRKGEGRKVKQMLYDILKEKNKTGIFHKKFNYHTLTFTENYDRLLPVEIDLKKIKKTEKPKRNRRLKEAVVFFLKVTNESKKKSLIKNGKYWHTGIIYDNAIYETFSKGRYKKSKGLSLFKRFNEIKEESPEFLKVFIDPEKLESEFKRGFPCSTYVAKVIGLDLPPEKVMDKQPVDPIYNLVKEKFKLLNKKEPFVEIKRNGTHFELLVEDSSDVPGNYQKVELNKDDLKDHRAVAGAIIKNGKLLLLFSNKFKLWTIPMGKVDEGEELEESLIREMEEEVGIKVKKFKYSFKETYTYDRNGKKVKVDQYGYEILSYSGIPRNEEPEKHAQMKWVDPKELNEIIEKGLATTYLLDVAKYIYYKKFKENALFKEVYGDILDEARIDTTPYKMNTVNSQLVYHGSPKQGLTEISIRKAKNTHNKKFKPKIYGTTDPSFAVGFCFPWAHSSGIKLYRKKESSWTLEVPKNIAEDLFDKPCSLYQLESKDFKKAYGTPTPEVISEKSAKVIKEIKFESVWKALELYGVDVELKEPKIIDNEDKKDKEKKKEE